MVRVKDAMRRPFLFSIWASFTLHAAQERDPGSRYSKFVWDHPSRVGAYRGRNFKLLSSSSPTILSDVIAKPTDQPTGTGPIMVGPFSNLCCRILLLYTFILNARARSRITLPLTS
ncbi:hypothetical protein BKA61DRAFT_622984, partial [Leptodontidium sp. MPI-SDFR-AT-0119]